jgi:hypothetical protein
MISCKYISFLHDDSKIGNISWFDDFLQIYFISEKKGERIAIEGSKGADVNEGKF